MAVAADLMDAPVNFEPVIVRIAAFDGELTSGAASPDEVYCNPVAAQMVARPDHLVEGGHFECDMIQLDISRFRLHRAD